MTSAKPATSDTPAAPRRAAEIKLIHAMRRELALAEDSYRALIGRISGGRTESSAELDGAERERVIRELKRCGAGKKGRRGRPRFPDTPQVRKIRALWLALAAAGAVRDRSEAALAAFVRRQTGQEVGALAADDANRAIEALKSWLARVEAGAEAEEGRPS